MKKEIVAGLILALLLIGISALAFNIQLVKSDLITWIVDDDGPANFHTIQEAVNAANLGDIIFVKVGTYHENVVINKAVILVGEDKEKTILTGNESGTGFQVAANNVTIKKFTVSAFEHGIYLSGRQDVLIEDMMIIGNKYGVRALYSSQIAVNGCFTINIYGVMLDHSSNSTIVNNFIEGYGAVTWGGDGVSIHHSIYNMVDGNVITFCRISLWMYSSHYNLIKGNILNGSSYGVELSDCMNNTLFHNNFLDNKLYDASPFFLLGKPNFWDNGYEGNYWSKYDGVDEDLDGIGDNPYTIAANNTDRYPLMGLFWSFELSWEGEKHCVTMISNSSISDFHFDGSNRLMKFNTYGLENSSGFCRIAIPNTLVQDWWQNNYEVLVENQQLIYVKNWTNFDQAYIYLVYQNPARNITILLELPSTAIMLLLIITVTLFIVSLKKIARRSKHGRFTQ